MMNESRKVSSLRELAQGIDPPRDLWPQIQVQLPAAEPPRRRGPTRAQWIALAATIAALAIGIWVGRATLQFPGTQPASNVDTAAWIRAAYVKAPRYVNERAALVKSLEARLQSMPEESRAKVLASLETIRKSMHEIELALGRDPGNALLQELLLNTHQDEMRVLTAVQEVSVTGEEI
jgi:hypothetical protein